MDQLVLQATHDAQWGGTIGHARSQATLLATWKWENGVARIRTHDWASTLLGSIERWPLFLRLALTTVLHSSLLMLGRGFRTHHALQ